MKLTKYIQKTLGAFIFLSLGFSSVVYGQKNEASLFKAMQDEMTRTKNELKLPGALPTYFVGYTIAENKYISIISSLGTITYTKESPRERVNSVKLYVGDNNFSSDYSYSGNGIRSNTLMTRDDSYDHIRYSFWQTSDLAYKFAVEVYNSKKSAVKTATISEEEKALPDMLPISYPEVSTPVIPEFNLNRKSYQDLANKLSKIFCNYSSVFNSSVGIDGIETIYYYLTSEGTKIKEPVGYVSISVKGSIRNRKGQVIEDQKTIYAKSFDKLPAEDILIASVKDFAERLSSLIQAPNMDEYYLGPVLFEDEASAKIFADNLVSPSGILSFRHPYQVVASVTRAENVSEAKNVKPLEERMGKKVIDSRLNVVNRTDLSDFGGFSLIGSYNYDGQGVAPIKNLSLIENGILKNMLSSRVPTIKIKTSSGSMRFGVSPRSVINSLAPGVLIVSAPSGEATTTLKTQLLNAAKEEGLDYAYIVRNFASGSGQYLYKVSVKDGSETLVTGAEISPIQFIKLKRVLGVSKDDFVYNYLYKESIPTSIIAPKSVLIEDIEIVNKPLTIQKESPLIGK
ncbi:MAG TPA: metallopeptidase TldD-related protein [Bacteroidales bacterium]|nr:hypothetical protein [Bacteroidales bacterium]HON55120.1 metallopeptidase TldD-related protein [Bacteroidales bacterium]HRR49705.1 metallopeptidase TldD-related protein [Bacteroidales bacterium]HRT33575.1 metallopeptidase TldD-related protein [Bacteroidales bacterium]HRT84354.1 metallopeptidase TldD-related protein [Bacteroidales bacterium]